MGTSIRRVVFVSLVVAVLGGGAVMVAVGSHARRFSATDGDELARVARAVEGRVPQIEAAKVSRISCSALTDERMACRAPVESLLGPAEIAYHATVDTHSGKFQISPIFAVRQR